MARLARQNTEYEVQWLYENQGRKASPGIG